MPKKKLVSPVTSEPGERGPARVHSERMEEVFWRRRFLREQVYLKGFISYADLKKSVQAHRSEVIRDLEKKAAAGDPAGKAGLIELRKLGEQPKVSSQTVLDDLEFWRKLGVDLRSVPAADDKREKWIIDAGAPHVASQVPRTNLNLDDKRRIAAAAMGMICGFGYIDDGQRAFDPDAAASPDRFDEYPEQAAEFKGCLRWPAIADELSRTRTASRENIRSAALSHLPTRAQATAEKVLSRLKLMQNEDSRTIALDAGTTNDQIVELIANLVLPSPISNLCHLTVCTNSRFIFQKLGEADVPTKVIIIGGEQRSQTAAVCGRLSELFLMSAGLLQFGISFIGATAIDFSRQTVCSDSQEEARLKTLFFDRSSIRVVCADFSKWQDQAMRSVFGFAHINPDHFDLLLTAEPEHDKKRFQRMVETVEGWGIPVFVSPRRVS